MNKFTAIIVMTTLLGGVFFIASVSAATPSVVINEIAWMGTDVSSSDEWVVPQKTRFLSSLL